MSKNEEKEEELALLLPWYVNGTLDSKNTQLINQALERDDALMRQYELVLEDQVAAIELTESEEVPEHMSERFRVSFNQKLDRDVVIATAETGQKSSFIADLMASLFPTRTVAFAAVAALLVIAIQAGFLVSEGTPKRFETATGDVETVTSIEFLVQLTPNATVSSLTQFLNEHQAEIISGPTSDGLYRLRFKKGDRVPLEEKLSNTVTIFTIVLPVGK